MPYALINNPPPNQTDYTAFLRSLGFDTTVLPDASPYIPNTLQVAIDTLNQDLYTAAPNEGTIATYNLAADILVNTAPDQAPALFSLTWISGIVTATAAASLPTNLVVGGIFVTTISGASPAGYNGTQQATVTAGNAFTYPLAGNPGAETSPGTYTASFFATLRKQWNINAVTVGVVSASSDESTSSSYLNLDAMKEFTLENLQQLKTPYGRVYLAFAQKYGQSLWGLT